MKMKIKTLVYITMSVSIIILCVFLASLINKGNKKVVFQCVHTLIIDMKKKSGLVKFRTNTKYVYYNNGTTVKSDVGTMSADGVVSVIYRDYISNYHLDGNIISFTVQDVKKAKKDTAPDNESLLQADKKITYHATISKLPGDAYLLKLQGFPIAVCT